MELCLVRYVVVGIECRGAGIAKIWKNWGTSHLASTWQTSPSPSLTHFKGNFPTTTRFRGPYTEYEEIEKCFPAFSRKAKIEGRTNSVFCSIFCMGHAIPYMFHDLCSYLCLFLPSPANLPPQHCLTTFQAICTTAPPFSSIFCSGLSVLSSTAKAKNSNNRP